MASSTKESFALALKKMMTVKPMEKITVKDLVEICGVNRQTFYYHFDDIYDLLEYDVLYQKDEKVLHIENARVHKNTVIIKFREITDMNTAEKMQNTVLYTEKVPLPEGRYYIKDLIGLTAITAEGELGELTDVFNTGANDIYEIRKQDGRKLYLPVIEGVIGDVDLTAKTIFVTVPDGLED